MISCSQRYENDVIDAFAIVSSDSDFAPLVKRLREAGKHVVGIGRASTPQPFRSSCNVFVESDGLVAPPAEQPSAPLRPPSSVLFRPPEAHAAAHVDPQTERVLFDVVNAAAAESQGGWARLSTVERLLLGARNDFDARSYGAAHVRAAVRTFRRP